jgi:hypothetical protein
MSHNPDQPLAPGLPILRGTLHATLATLIPTITACIVIQWPDRAHDAAVVSAVGFIQLALSARLHLCHHLISARNLRWTQTLDQCAIGISLAGIAWSFGAWMPPVYVLMFLHIVCKLAGPHEYARRNAWTIGALFVVGTWLVFQNPLTWAQKIRYCVVFANIFTAQMTYLLQWPCNGHPVWGYHEISHITVAASLALMWWNVIDQ